MASLLEIFKPEIVVSILLNHASPVVLIRLFSPFQQIAQDELAAPLMRFSNEIILIHAVAVDLPLKVRQIHCPGDVPLLGGCERADFDQLRIEDMIERYEIGAAFLQGGIRAADGHGWIDSQAGRGLSRTVTDHFMHVYFPLARAVAEFVDDLPVVRQIEFVDRRFADLFRARLFDVQKNDVLASIVPAQIGIIRQVVGRRGNRTAVTRFDHYVHDIRDRFGDLLQLELILPGHLLLEVQSVGSQALDQRGIGHEADVPCKLADDAPGVHVGFDEAVEVVDDRIRPQPVNRILTELFFIPGGVMIQKSLNPQFLLLALRIGQGLLEEKADGFQVLSVQSADFVDLRRHFAAFHGKADVQPLLPFQGQALDVPLREPPVIEVHRAGCYDVVPLLLVSLNGIHVRVKNDGTQALQLGCQRFFRLEFEPRSARLGEFGRLLQRLARQIIRQGLDVGVVIVGPMIDPDVFEIVVHGMLRLFVHPVRMAVNLLEHVADFDRVPVILIICNDVSGDGCAIEIVDEDLLPLAERIEAGSVNSQYEEVFAVLAEPLQLTDHAPGLLRHRRLLGFHRLFVSAGTHRQKGKTQHRNHYVIHAANP